MLTTHATFVKVAGVFFCGIAGAVFSSAGRLGAEVQSTPVVVNPQAVQVPVTSQVVSGSLSSTDLVWDSEIKAVEVPSGEIEAHFTFNFTNTSSIDVTIVSVSPSCGCTTAQLPPLPWTVEPGTNGQIGITVNLAGKHGELVKTVTVNANKVSKVLTVKATILPPAVVPVASGADQVRSLLAVVTRQVIAPGMFGTNRTSNAQDVPTISDPNRARSFQIAKIDRQAIFENDCASCHIAHGKGKYGKDLYDSVCGVCHESPHRASMVPNLHNITQATNAEFWRTWIEYGRPHSLMPAFSDTESGSLTSVRIVSLANYLATAIPSRHNELQ